VTNNANRRHPPAIAIREMAAVGSRDGGDGVDTLFWLSAGVVGAGEAVIDGMTGMIVGTGGTVEKVDSGVK
jgi:hypothetical protein